MNIKMGEVLQREMLGGKNNCPSSFVHVTVICVAALSAKPCSGECEKSRFMKTEIPSLKSSSALWKKRKNKQVNKPTNSFWL